MISVEEAKNIINENLPERIIKAKDIYAVQGLVLAEDIFSQVNLPGFTNSAMDGFAVKWEDVSNAGNSSVKLEIIGESAAGIPFQKEGANGNAVRINTGALIPDEFDTVVPVENVEVEDSTVFIKSVKKKHQNVRYAGEEFKSGDLLLSKNTLLGPPELALLASAGIKSVKVFESPKISIIVTGSELVSYDAETSEAQIRESNGIMLSSLVRESGSNVAEIKRIGDSLDETKEAIKEAELNSDIIILSGGVSVGPHDHVKEASIKNGFKELFWKVNQKPGKPFYFARKDSTLLFGLPGNPVSALICAVHYIFPVLNEFMGSEFNIKKMKSISANEIINKQNRAHFMRAKIVNETENKIEIKVLDKQASHMLSTLTEADGYILLQPEQKIKSEKEIIFYPFPWRKKWVI